LRLHNLEIVQMFVQSQNCANILGSLKIDCTISRLTHNFHILRMRSAISRFCKFLDCAEHIYYYYFGNPWGKLWPHSQAFYTSSFWSLAVSKNRGRRPGEYCNV